MKNGLVSALELGQPLQHEYRVERKARIAGVKTQAWGILCVHTKEKSRNRGNVNHLAV